MADTIFSVSISIVLILLIRKLFARHVPARLIYALWLIPTIQLLLFGHSLCFDTTFYRRFYGILGISPLQRVAPDVYDVLEQNLNHVLVQGESFAPELMKKDEMTMVHTGISVWEVLRIIWAAGATVTATCLFVPLFRTWRCLRRHRQRTPQLLHGQKVYPINNLSRSFLFCWKIYIDSEQARNEEQSYFIVRHEAMHRRQGDDLWNLLRGVCVVLYWFHPLVWIAAIVSKTDSEYACDERTMQKMDTEERRSYGKTLLELATMESYVRKKEAVYYEVSDGRLKERIQRITAKDAKGKEIKEAAFFVSAFILIFLIGLFAEYEVVYLVGAGQYKKIQTYTSYPVTEQIYADSVTYRDGQLYSIIKSETDELCEITDKWLEREENGQFKVVVKNNLQRKENVVFHLGGKDTLENDSLSKPGERSVAVLVSYDNKERYLVDSLTEEFDNNYSELEDGNYRMNYVLWHHATNEYKLLRVPFSVQSDW